MKAKKKDLLAHNSAFGWLAAAIVVILLIPLVAMQFTPDVQWTLFDFAVAGFMLFSLGGLFILAARRFPNNRLLISLGFLLLTVYLWAEMAVGVFTHIGS